MKEFLIKFLERQSTKVPWPVLWLSVILVYMGVPSVSVGIVAIFALKPIFDSLNKAGKSFLQLLKSWKKVLEEFKNWRK